MKRTEQAENGFSYPLLLKVDGCFKDVYIKFCSDKNQIQV